MPGLGVRYLASAALFLGGLALLLLAGFPWLWLGVPLLLLGHLPLWVRGQSNAPGGATPEHEEIWVPTDDDWAERLTALETKAAAWDATPWDFTNLRGCLVLGAVLIALWMAVLPAVGAWLGSDASLRFAIGAALLVVPVWLNGIRTVWHPSELRLKGQALAEAREAAMTHGADKDFDLVPMLALREGEKGKYPVDARLMLRPKEDDGSGFLGVQLQVALNNVQGRDYPYLYAVVLGKKGFDLPHDVRRHRGPSHQVRFVFERGHGQGANYLVVRQHADRSGGWHTKKEHIDEIVDVALEEAHRAWEENRRPGRR
jgi:hypothetical protein